MGKTPSSPERTKRTDLRFSLSSTKRETRICNFNGQIKSLVKKQNKTLDEYKAKLLQCIIHSYVQDTISKYLPDNKSQKKKKKREREKGYILHNCG